MDIDRYLQRIGHGGPVAPDHATLVALHRAHLFSVPFENLDIHRGHAIVLDLERLFDKIVTRRRGGICYELNGLFAELLRAIGFEVVQVAAEVALDDGRFSPPFDHMALLVAVDGAWFLTDVGFGDSFTEPLALASPDEHAQSHGVFQIRAESSHHLLLARKPFAEGPLRPSFRFTCVDHPLADYEAMCLHHQSSPDSHFTRKEICSLATPDGRISLGGARLVMTSGATRSERPCASSVERTQALREHFGMVL